MHTKRKENKQRRQRQAQIQSTRRQEIQSPPPPEMSLLDPVLENEAHDAPGEVVEWRGGRDGACAAEDQGRHEVLKWGFRVAFGAEVDGDGDDGAEDEEEEEGGVDAAGGEHAVWADETPYYGCYIFVSGVVKFYIQERFLGGTKYRRRRLGRRGR